MKKYVLALLLMSMGFGFTNALIAQQFTLTGKVFDKATGKTLAGASVYLPEIKKGTITNKEGVFTINIEQGSHVLEISYMGYATDVENIKLQNNLTQDFYLNSSVLEGGNVIVTSFLRATSTRRTPTPVTIIKKEELFRGVSTNLIDALSKVPGVSQISTGPAISKPIIRGLGYNRVVVMNDGIRQEGQQWGDEHGIEVDESYYIFPEYADDTKTSIRLYSGDIIDKSPFRLGLKFGAQYEILAGSLLFVPAVYYNLGLTKVNTGDNWTVSALQIGADLRFSL